MVWRRALLGSAYRRVSAASAGLRQFLEHLQNILALKSEIGLLLNGETENNSCALMEPLTCCSDIPREVKILMRGRVEGWRGAP